MSGRPVNSPVALLWPAIACATLGLAPFAPEPHVWGKLRWAFGGAAGMGPVDWFDLVMHLSPWIWLAVALVRWRVGRRAPAAQP